MRPRKLLAVLMLVFAVGCGGGEVQLDPGGESPAAKKAGDEGPFADVDWTKYAESVRTRLEKLADDVDCGKLQNEFDNAEANDSTDLMVLIDSLLKQAGCYE